MNWSEVHQKVMNSLSQGIVVKQGNLEVQMFLY